MQLQGTIMKNPVVGTQRLPSAALGFAVGGSMATSPDDQSGTKAAEQFFEIHIAPDTPLNVHLITGQRVVVRFEEPSKPLKAQWWRSLQQLFQRRFSI